MTSGCPAPPARQYRWLRRRSRPASATLTPAHTATLTDEPIVIVQDEGDFVVCGYGGCGGLRPLATPDTYPACPVCGRL